MLKIKNNFRFLVKTFLVFLIIAYITADDKMRLNLSLRLWPSTESGKFIFAFFILLFYNIDFSKDGGFLKKRNYAVLFYALFFVLTLANLGFTRALSNVAAASCRWFPEAGSLCHPF